MSLVQNKASKPLGMAGEVLPATSVVIPTYNRGSALVEIVSPLLRDPFPEEIIVVVDGSDDGSMEILEGLARSDGRLKPIWIPNSGEMGARGTGVTRATGEVVVMFDDDVRARPGLSRRHAAWHATGERLVVIGYMPPILPTKRVEGSFATYMYAHEYEKACRRYEAKPEEILHSLWAGNISLRRKDAVGVGLPSPWFSARYHQDREFGLRCLKDGLVGVFDRQLEAEHMHHRGLESFRRDARAQGAGRRRLHDLHGDVLGSLTNAGYRQNLSRSSQCLVRAVHKSTVYKTTTAITVAIIRLAGRLRLFGVEMAGAKLLRRIEQERGAAEYDKDLYGLRSSGVERIP